MFLLHPTLDDFTHGLESWDWLDFSGKVPFLTTAFGDVFFDSKEGVYFLDKVSGKLELICESKQALQDILNTADGQDHYLMTSLVLLARDRGLILNDDECYDFKVAPSLNGEIKFENLQKMDFKVSLNITGQLLKQIKDLPPGTKISEVKLADS